MHREIAFEDAIGRAMHEAGWRPGQPADYRRELGLDTAMLMEFFGATQAQRWDKLVAYSGGDSDAAQRAFAERLAKEVDDLGARRRRRLALRRQRPWPALPFNTGSEGPGGRR